MYNYNINARAVQFFLAYLFNILYNKSVFIYEEAE